LSSYFFLLSSGLVQGSITLDRDKSVNKNKQGKDIMCVAKTCQRRRKQIRLASKNRGKTTGRKVMDEVKYGAKKKK